MTSDESSYEHQSYRDQSEEGIMEKFRKRLENDVSLLADNPYSYLSKISGPVKQSYIRVRNIYDNYITQGHSSKEGEILKDILNEQYKPSNISSNTVGSFLFGCYQSDYGEVTKYCSPICADGIHHEKQQSCPRQIWALYKENKDTNNKRIHSDTKRKSYENRKFIRLGDNERSNQANIYIYQETLAFKGLTDKEIHQLKSEGVNKITFYSSSNSRFFKMDKTMDLSRVPVDHIPKVNNGINLNHIFSNKNDSTNGSMMFLVVIVVILVIIAIAFMLMWNPSNGYYSYNSTFTSFNDA